MTSDDVVVRPFADWLREQSKGSSHDELSDALHALVGRVQETGRKGSLSYTVTVAPSGDDAVLVTDEIKTRLPEHRRPESLFFTDTHGNLTRRDPRQLDFSSLREVDTDTGEIIREAHQ